MEQVGHRVHEDPAWLPPLDGQVQPLELGKAATGITGSFKTVKALTLSASDFYHVTLTATRMTVQVNTGSDPTSTLLQNCATDAGKFFLLTEAGQMVTTFGQIGTSLSKLRLAM